MDTETLDAQPVESEVAVDDHGTTELEAIADSSPASEETHEEKSSGVQGRINKLTAKRYEAERAAEALRLENEALKAAKSPAPVADQPVAPSMPEDTFDSEAMAKYHADMIAYTDSLTDAKINQSFQTRKQQEQELAQKAQRQQVVSSYIDNAVTDGVDMDKLAVAERTLNEAGINQVLGNFIMSDKHGGKIATYLHDNPAMMYEVLSLDPVSAGIKIANEVKPLALKTTSKVSNAPEPTPDISGGGVVDRDDFERSNPGTVFI